MANKLKISHFAPTSSSDSNPLSSNTLDHSSLARLYPKSKTFEQKKQDDKLRQQAYRRHWPKRPQLNIAVYGSILLAGFIWFIQSLGDSWLGNSSSGLIVSTVFFTFGLAIGLGFLLIAWINYVNKLLYYFGGLLKIFWLVYAASIAVLLTAWLSGWIWEYTNILWVPVLVILHFIMVFFDARSVLGKVS